jgi:HNH endonuclease/AP2 domain
MAEVTRTMTGELRWFLEYNPETGEFFWKISSRGNHVGDLAGSVYPNGYRYIQIEGLDYRAGRLAWFFVTGEDPVEFIDHINKNRDDNRFSNLRKSTNSQNQANALWSTNTSGIKGVSWQSSRSKWIAVITINGIAKNLGRYDSIVDAAKAYRAAAIEVWGEFALVPSDEEITAVSEELEKAGHPGY